MCMICYARLQQDGMVNARVSDAGIWVSDAGNLQDIADYLREGYWLHVQDEAPLWSTDEPITYELLGLDEQYTLYAETAFEAWAAATGLEFAPLTGTGSADIIVTDDEAKAFASHVWQTYPNGVVQTDFVQINVAEDWAREDGSDELGFESYTYATFIHEVGHAIGLGHAGPYNATTNLQDGAIFANDSWQVSVMSYFTQVENPRIDADYATHLSPMPADLLAIQDIYGDLADINPGDDRYFNGASGGYFQDMTAMIAGNEFSEGVTLTLVDEGGLDLLDLSTDFEGINLDLNPGSINDIYATKGSFLIGEETVIEQAYGGAGDDRILGNDADNVLSGGAGRNHLDGGEGFDRALFDFDLAEAEVQAHDKGFRITSGDRVDDLFGFEEFAFADQSVAAADLQITNNAPIEDPPEEEPSDESDDEGGLMEGLGLLLVMGLGVAVFAAV